VAQLQQGLVLPKAETRPPQEALLRGDFMSLLTRVQQFFSDIQRIREALERISPPKQPPDPRRNVYSPRTYQSDK
jgi:hypothetical protein